MVWDIYKENEVKTKFSLIMFLCSILVIFIHTYNLEVYNIDKNSIGLSYVVFSIETYFSKLTKIAVPLFFLISGLLFFKTFEITSLLSKWRNRISTIVIPYLIWCTLYYLYLVLCTNIPFINSLMNSTDKVILSVHTWINSLWIDKYYTLWFLQNLIIFILLSPIIFILIKNHYSNIKTGFIILIILLIIKSKVTINTPYLSGIEMYLIGSYIGLNCKDYLVKKNTTISIIAAIYIGLVLISSFSYWNLLTETLFYLSIWYALDLINIKNIKIPWWMSITFFTYVAHDVLLEGLEKIFLLVCGTKPIFALLDYIFMPLIVELILIFVAYFMRKRLPAIWKIITGGR